MIAFLTGRLHEKHPNRLIVDVNGVGYDVNVPLSTFYDVGDAGAAVSLHVHTRVREDAIALYGFGTRLELQIFELLIGINGVGPKLALAVLSGIESGDLVRAVRTGDVARLTAIPGVGKKTAERVLLEMRDRLPKALTIEAASPAAEAGGTTRDDLLSALVNLGYHRPLAEKAVESVLKKQPDLGFEQALREVLRAMAR
jgi:Holliday junction DNA helicase RuvA